MEKVIVITGGSEGLGKALAKKLCLENKVVVLARNKEKLEEVCNAFGVECEVCDVSDSKQVECAVNNIYKRHKQIDILINCAGIMARGELVENDFDLIKKVIDINLTGLINMTRAVLPQMKERRDGMIININSQGGIAHYSERSLYHASKWGVTGFTKNIQDEVAKYNIRVTDVLPGLMQTNIFKNAGFERSFEDALNPEDVAGIIEYIIKLPKDIIIPEIGIKNIRNYAKS